MAGKHANGSGAGRTMPCGMQPRLAVAKTENPANDRVLPETVVGRAGFEPATNGLKVRCSTS